jgi:putative transcriptional regulator
VDVTSAPRPAVRMRELRSAKGLTHQQLADLVGSSRNTIGEIERGQQEPSLETARRIARALESDLNTVFGQAELVEAAS